jgi:acyl-CoA synthetase (AMP-forming)/AMP-acid ligase II
MSFYLHRGSRGFADSSAPDGRVPLDTLRELPKSLYATKLAVTTYPSTRGARKAVFNHIEVFKNVETVANRLRESGVRPGTVCASALPNSYEAVVYFFALQWIGAIAAPSRPPCPR